MTFFLLFGSDHESGVLSANCPARSANELPEELEFEDAFASFTAAAAAAAAFFLFSASSSLAVAIALAAAAAFEADLATDLAFLAAMVASFIAELGV